MRNFVTEERTVDTAEYIRNGMACDHPKGVRG